MSKTIEVSKEAAIEFRRLHDEVAMMRNLIEKHNLYLQTTCAMNRREKDKCLDYARIGPHRHCGDCAKDYIIDLPEPNHE